MAGASSPAFSPLFPSNAAVPGLGPGGGACAPPGTGPAGMDAPPPLLFAPTEGLAETKGVALIANSSLPAPVPVPVLSLSRSLLARERSRYSLMDPTRSSSMSLSTGESFSLICLMT